MENNNLEKIKIKPIVWVIIFILSIIILFLLILLIIQINMLCTNIITPNAVVSNSDYGVFYPGSSKLTKSSSFIPGIYSNEVYIISIPNGVDITTITSLLNASQASSYQCAIAAASVCYSNLSSQASSYANSFLTQLFTSKPINVYGDLKPSSAGNAVPITNNGITLTSTGQYNMNYSINDNSFTLNDGYSGNIYALYGVKPKLLQNAALGDFCQKVYIGDYFCSIYFWSYNLWSMYSV